MLDTSRVYTSPNFHQSNAIYHILLIKDRHIHITCPRSCKTYIEIWCVFKVVKLPGSIFSSCFWLCVVCLCFGGSPCPSDCLSCDSCLCCFGVGLGVVCVRGLQSCLNLHLIILLFRYSRQKLIVSK